MRAWTLLPMDYANLKVRIDRLRKQFSCVQVSSIGRSLLGKEMFALCFSPGSPQREAPGILFAGAFHGMEWITSTLLLAFAERLCVRLEQGTFTLTKPLWIVPCANPDGVNIQIHGLSAAGRFSNLVRTASRGNPLSHWQANARGVDLNHNFDANWKVLRRLEIQSGICGPAPTRFGGCFPLSEPESRNLVRFCRSHSVAAALAFHSQGEEIYYRFGDSLPDGSLEIAKRLADVSGYALSDPPQIASYGGFKDWFILEFDRPAFTIEVGKGKNPLPTSDFPNIFPKVEAICTAMLT